MLGETGESLSRSKTKESFAAATLNDSDVVKMSFKDFRVLETIGKGSFASVYKVR